MAHGICYSESYSNDNGFTITVSKDNRDHPMGKDFNEADWLLLVGQRVSSNLILNIGAAGDSDWAATSIYAPNEWISEMALRPVGDNGWDPFPDTRLPMLKWTNDHIMNTHGMVMLSLNSVLVEIDNNNKPMQGEPGSFANHLVAFLGNWKNIDKDTVQFDVYTWGQLRTIKAHKLDAAKLMFNVYVGSLYGLSIPDKNYPV